MKKMTKVGLDCAVNQPVLKTRLQDHLDEPIETPLPEAVEVDMPEWSFESLAEMEQYIEELRFFRS